MTHSSDGWGDMRDEQLPDEPLLTDFLAELRSWGVGEAPAPSVGLAMLLDADHVAPVAPVDPVPQPIRRKRMFVAKLAGLGVAAKVALGVGVAAAAVTTAGAGGVLPDAAQHGVAVAVNAVSPLDIPDRAKDKAVADDILAPDADTDVDVTAPTTSVPGVGDPTVDDDGDDPTGDDEATDNHGACVSAVARDKGLTGREHGQAVSAIAQSDCGKEGETTTTTSPSTTTTTTTVPDDGDESQAPSENAGPGNSGGNGNGNGNKGKGSGNS